MRILKTYIVIFISSFTLFGFMCDPDYAPPEVERCLILSKKMPSDPQSYSKDDLILWMNNQKCFCTDKRLPDNQREYEKPLSYCRAYESTSADDFAILADHWDSIVRELKDCEDRELNYLANPD